MSTPEIVDREHYPYVTRVLIDLYNEGKLTNVDNIIIEPEYGYVVRLDYADGGHRITYGNDLGLNSGAACDLAKDKGYTKFMLRAIGVNCPDGEEFLLPWWAEQIGPTQIKRGNTTLRTTDTAADWVSDNLGWPVYIKPVQGSKGGDVYRVGDRDLLDTTLSGYEQKRIRVAVIEEAINLPDYRLVMLDSSLISAYRRIPLSVTGDGLHNIGWLVEELQRTYEAEGRDTRLNAQDPRILQHLSSQGLGLSFVPDSECLVGLASISNLSVGGTSEDVTDRVDQSWIDLAAKIAANFNLRLCGIDLACGDIANAKSAYSVLEVNAAPGLDHYASSGEVQRKIVADLYTLVLNTSA